MPEVRHWRAPRGVLGELVELLWLYDGYVRPHAQERLLPMPTAELVIDLRGAMSSTQAATVAGPHSQYWALDTAAATSVVGVHLRAGGVFAFFDFPASELHNVRVPLDTLWGARARSLVEQVLAARTADAKFDALEQALLAAARTLGRHRAVTYALRELSAPPPGRSVAEVSNAIGMSQRRFLERFRSEVGMAPKLFGRVQRFQSVIASVHTLREVNWAAVAAQCGYFDQAHFIHDFHAFSGFTPTAYLALRGKDLNHVPLPG